MRSRRVAAAPLAVALVTAMIGPSYAEPAVTDRIAVGAFPSGVAVTPDSGRAYVTLSDDDAVAVIGTATGIVQTTIGVGSGPYGVAVAPDGRRAYVTNFSSDTVSVIDTAANDVVTEIDVGDSPNAVAVNPDGGHAYVTNIGSETVSVVDTGTNTVEATIAVGFNPVDVAVSPDGGHAYVASFGADTVSVLDTRTNTVDTTIAVGIDPAGAAVAPDGTRAFVTNYTDNSVSVIDTDTNTVVATIDVDEAPMGVAITPDGTRALVTNFLAGKLSLIDIATNTLAGPPISGLIDPMGVVVTPDGSRAYITERNGNAVSVLALQPSPPTGVAASPGDSRLAVTWGPPDFTGGEAITSYTATALPGGATCTTDGATTCTIEGLSNGTEYAVTVTATNSIGTSAPSDPSAPVKPSAPAITLAPKTVDFGAVTVGRTSESRTITVTNDGPGTVRVTRTAIDGGGFGITEDACALVEVAAGAACILRVTFAPWATGQISGQLTITSTAAGSPHTLGLTGTGVTSSRVRQTLAAKLPKRIKVDGLTVLTPANARTNAGRVVRTSVRGGPVKTSSAGQTRYFTVIRGKKGRTAIRTYGYPKLRLKVRQKAAAVSGYTAFKRTVTYTRGKRR